MSSTTQAPKAEGGGKGPSKGRMPVYTLNPVDDLPAEPPTRRGGHSRYMELLSQVVDNPDLQDTWLELATFVTPNGAAKALEAINAGERSIPPGEWDFQTRKFDNPDTNERGSKLYAYYDSEASAASAGTAGATAATG